MEEKKISYSIEVVKSKLNKLVNVWWKNITQKLLWYESRDC